MVYNETNNGLLTYPNYIIKNEAVVLLPKYLDTKGFWIFGVNDCLLKRFWRGLQKVTKPSPSFKV